jgi:hypothetical protein
VVTICTASLTFSNSTFCPQSVFMCFVWIWEQTAIISLYSINWLVFITEIWSVYCAVRTEYLNVIQVNATRSRPCHVLGGQSPATYFGGPCSVLVDKVALQGFSRSISVFPRQYYPTIAPAQLHLNTEGQVHGPWKCSSKATLWLQNACPCLVYQVHCHYSWFG